MTLRGTLRSRIAKDIEAYLRELEARTVRWAEISKFVDSQFPEADEWDLRIARDSLLRTGRIFRVSWGLYIHRERVSPEEFPQILLTHKHLRGLVGLKELAGQLYRLTSERRIGVVQEYLRELESEYEQARRKVDYALVELRSRLEEVLSRAEQMRGEVPSPPTEAEDLSDLVAHFSRLLERFVKNLDRELELRDALTRRTFHGLLRYGVSGVTAERYVPPEDIEYATQFRDVVATSLFFLPLTDIKPENILVADTNSLVALLLVEEIETESVLDAFLQRVGIHITKEIENELLRVLGRDYPQREKRAKTLYWKLKRAGRIEVRYNYSRSSSVDRLGLDKGEASGLHLVAALSREKKDAALFFVTEEFQKRAGMKMAEVVQSYGGVFVAGIQNMLNMLAGNCTIPIEKVRKVSEPILIQTRQTEYALWHDFHEDALRIAEERKAQ